MYDVKITMTAEEFKRVIDIAYEYERKACADAVRSRYMGDNNREDMEVLRCVAAIEARGASVKSTQENADADR